jgi:hypothetical protein
MLFGKNLCGRRQDGSSEQQVIPESLMISWRRAERNLQVAGDVGFRMHGLLLRWLGARNIKTRLGDRQTESQAISLSNEGELPVLIQYRHLRGEQFAQHGDGSDRPLGIQADT